MTDLIDNDPVPRLALMLISAGSFFSTLLGISFALFGPGLTPFEEITLPIICVSSLVSFSILWFTGERFFINTGRIMITLSGVHLVSNIANQMLIDSGGLFSTLIFSSWLPGYYVLAFVVLGKRLAQKICWTIFTVVLLLHLAIYSTLPGSAFSSDFAVAVSLVLLLTQPCVIGLLSALLSYRVKLEATDIAQQEILLERELLTNILDSINPGVVVFDKTGHLILSNSSLSKATEDLGIPLKKGISWGGLAQYVADSGAQNAHQDDASGSWLKTITQLHKAGGGSSQFDLPDGRSFLVYERLWEDGTSVITLTNVSELKRNRETISQLQKMEALGRLTGGIAHDFNNLLSIILGNLETIQLKLGDDQELSELVAQATMQTQKGATLIRQLLAFARGSKLKLSQVDPVSLIEEMLPITQSAIGEHIEVKLLPSATSEKIHVESDLLQSMVINLALNARDAMLEGGTFTIEIKQQKFEETESKDGLVGDFIALAFTDTGAGISTENQQRVFEPFYTTKSMDGGSGLGLSMVYGLAKQFDGDVRITSELGTGTTATLFFPVSPDQPSQESPFTKPTEEQKFDGNVLLIEDNEDLRMISKLRLSRLGFNVTEAASLEEAKTEFVPGKFNLVFSDVILPDGNGYNLAKELAAIDTNVSILLTSGYTELNTATGSEAKSNFAFIQKPHSNLELAESISSLLD